ncbi:retrovirus-related pol polyprotein from transposon TNT 1-94 [Tanacetum coccineum]|uniref:Retrovirus-related pol polyprotein from transposon TNT 1-94 n=1 Tax=Tanacetum coccineum TaxID=301880 RepID=A0ABQ4Y712_9ASTR
MLAKYVHMYNICKVVIELTSWSYRSFVLLSFFADKHHNTEGDAINFNEVNSFPDDEFIKPRSRVSQCSGNTEYFPYVPVFDRLPTNNTTIHENNITFIDSPLPQDSVSPEESLEFTDIDDHPAFNKVDHHGLANNLKPAEIQEDIINRWSREKHIELVNIIGEPLAGITTRSKIRDSEAASAHEFPRLKAIRIFLAYAAYMGFMIYQMDMKSAFLNGKISEEVYVQQPPGSESIEFPDYVCKLDKALYRLKQAPRAWYQANPKESHFVALKRFFRYLKGTLNLGLLYPKGSGFNLKAYSNSDYAGCNLDRKSTLRAKAEYVFAAGCCAQVLWIKSQLADYDVLYDKVPIFCDNTSAIAISNNPLLHSRTKHIDIRYHFIKDHILKGDIELHFVPTDLQLADIFTKPLAEPSFTILVVELDTITNTISFTFLKFDKPLSFDLDMFSSVIGLKPSENYVSFPPKKTLKAVLATLGLIDEKDTSLSSADLINSYKNDNLKSLKPYNIIAISFKPTWDNEVALTAHMYMVAELSHDPIKSLLPPFGEVNADDIANKSSSETSVQPTQPAEEPVATTDATQSLDTSVSAEEQVLDQNIKEEVKDAGLKSIGDVTFEQIMDEIDQKNKATQELPESPYDTESEIKFIKSFKVVTISGSFSIDQEEEEHTADADNITFWALNLLTWILIQ